MTAPITDAALVLAALRGGADARALPARYGRALLELVRSGDVAVVALAPSPTEPTEPTEEAPLTEAERAARYRARRRAERHEGRHGAVTTQRDAVRDAVTPTVTEPVTASRDAVASLSPSPLSSEVLPSPEASESEEKREGERVRDGVTRHVTPKVAARDASRDDLADRSDAERALVGVLLRRYRDAYERTVGSAWMGASSAAGHVEIAARWCLTEPDPEAAAERFIAGAFATPRWRRSRWPWRWLVEDPAATAAASTLPSAPPGASASTPLPTIDLDPLPASEVF